MTSNNAVIQLILEFIKSGSMQPASKPGFGHALKLSYNLISTENLRWNGENTLTYRYKFTRHVGKPTPALLLAIMDELTTNACFGVGKPSAPGLSLQMQMEITHGTGLDSFNELEVVSTVVKKGRTISFVKSNFFDPSTQSLVAFGSHVKYMPTGSFVMDMVFNNAWAWNLYTALGGISSNRPDEYPERYLWKEVIGAHLVYKGSGSATFNITQEHVNPMGGLHGGCHAVLMELVGETLARKQGPVVLESIQIDYISAGRGTIQIIAEPLSESQMQVGIYSEHGRVMSQGMLRWTLVTSTQSRL